MIEGSVQPEIDGSDFDPLEGLDLSPATRAMVRRVTENEPTQHTPEFERIRETAFQAQVCTSLTDQETTERINLVPSGTEHGWMLTADPPVACVNKPATHRHLLYEC